MLENELLKGPTRRHRETNKNTHSLLVWVHISDAEVVFLQEVEVVADEVKQVLSLRIPLEQKNKTWWIHVCTVFKTLYL